MIDGSGFLQEYMKGKLLEDQGEIAFNPFKFFGGDPLDQRKKLDEGTLIEKEIDTGAGIGDLLMRQRLREQEIREQLGL